MKGGDDQVLKEMITAFPGDFVRLAAPELAAKLRLDGIDFRQEEYFTDSPRGGRPRRPDLVATVPALAAHEPPIMLHVEIEYRYRRARGPKFLEYNQILGMRHGLVVHTLVLYLRGGPGGAAAAEYEVRSLGLRVMTFEYRTLGLTRACAQEYLARPEPLAWAFAALMRTGELGSHAELRVACLRRIARARRLSAARRFLLFNFVHSCIESDQGAAEEYDALVRAPGNKEVREMMLSFAERIRRAEEKGRQEVTVTLGAKIRRAEEEGRKEGRQEGRQEAHQAAVATLRQLVVRLATQRFGRASRGLERRIAKIDSVQELAGLAERIPAADSLDALGLRKATA